MFLWATLDWCTYTRVVFGYRNNPIPTAGRRQMFIATDTLTTHLAVEVYNLVREQGGKGIDALIAQGWDLARIDAYCTAGAVIA